MTDEPIFAAIRAGDVDGVRELVAADPSVASARDADGVSALLLARYHRRLDVVDALLATKPELDVFEAAALGDDARARELVDADPGLVDAFAPDGFYPLGLASFFGHAGIVRLLLERGADVTLRARNDLNVMALHAAAASGHNDIAVLLLEHGAPVGATQQAGYTPLHEAAENGNAELVRLLLEHGADPCQAKDDGRTARELAAAKGHDEIAALLGSSP